ncbi:hypothetical protein NIES4075_11530 [Tolypothrix sp. NIES-4075]|uniref:Uncharacterized protein n=1 Tax=Hassallia byssoidea VB512170 TaxID=1304833 RepID=A0A846H6A9_9CYAN|nr:MULTISPECIES: hypothetical protein [Tolypothrichaceae]NEU72101.1 hypothetical protein [Hassalia byssoidea VB512170]GAX40190.1 hypothetical protein NIES4075_11530 [Tolypothrix sp. NIES-4075]
MTTANYDAMSIDELRQYVLTHREDLEAFHLYIDRSKASGRMITIDPDNNQWEQDLESQIQQSTFDKNE